MALFPDPFDALLRLQRALDASHTKGWLEPGLSGGGTYPPVNVFRKGDDFIIIAELPGVQKPDLDIQVHGRTVRVAGKKSVAYPEKASVHRRERLAGTFDRAVTLPIEVNADSVRADYRDGVLALLLPRAEHDKPKQIKVG
jgi:HSP20 family protein